MARGWPGGDGPAGQISSAYVVDQHAGTIDPENPPPRNGTAHTWHHPLEVLDNTIANGGIAFGGVMPGFAEVLSSDDRMAIIAWFQSLWPDDIYERWQSIDERSRN